MTKRYSAANKSHSSVDQPNEGTHMILKVNFSLYLCDCSSLLFLVFCLSFDLFKTRKFYLYFSDLIVIVRNHNNQKTAEFN
jgi:hypothetical protein